MQSLEKIVGIHKPEGDSRSAGSGRLSPLSPGAKMEGTQCALLGKCFPSPKPHLGQFREGERSRNPYDHLQCYPSASFLKPHGVTLFHVTAANLCRAVFSRGVRWAILQHRARPGLDRGCRGISSSWSTEPFETTKRHPQTLRGSACDRGCLNGLIDPTPFSQPCQM